MAHRLAGVVLVVVVVVAVGTLGYHKVYGTWWQTPERIPYCGREYLRGTPAMSHADIEDRVSRSVNDEDDDNGDDQISLSDDGTFPVVTVGRAPPIVGRPLLTAFRPEATRRGDHVCPEGVFLQTGTDAYTAFDLSSGS